MNSTKTSVTFNYDELTPIQLARLYKFLVSLHQYVQAEDVLQAGIRNCGVNDFALEIARA